MDIAGVVTALSAISSIAIIAGAGFVVIQLRQNANLLNATLREERKDAAFSMLERLTDESFARRRATFYRVIEKHRGGDWTGYDDSADDFEVRSFAYQYELYGEMVKSGVIDFPMVANMLQYLAVNDWKEFQPVAEHLSTRFGEQLGWWRHFEWLAKETERYMKKKDEAGG